MLYFWLPLTEYQPCSPLSPFLHMNVWCSLFYALVHLIHFTSLTALCYCTHCLSRANDWRFLDAYQSTRDTWTLLKTLLVTRAHRRTHTESFKQLISATFGLSIWDLAVISVSLTCYVSCSSVKSQFGTLHLAVHTFHVHCSTTACSVSDWPVSRALPVCSCTG